MAKLAVAFVALLISRVVGYLCEDTGIDFYKEYAPLPRNSPPRRCLESWEYNRTFSASTKKPIAAALNPSAPFRYALGNLTAHFTKESARVSKLMKRKTPLFVEEWSRACGLSPDFSEIVAVNRSISLNGWGVMGEECTTQLSTELDETVVDSMRIYINELNRSAKAAVRAAGLNFEKPTTYMEFQYKGDIDKCLLLHFVGFRVNGQWRVNTGITNAALNDFKPDRQRHYLVEILHLVAGRVAPTPLTLPRMPRWDPTKRAENQTVPKEWVPRTTTLLASWAASPAGSLFREVMIPANNPAVQRAIAEGAETREQVQDATKPSNVAIAFVPLLLTLVPVSLFADISTPALITYALVTDILSALPLAIKGEELRRFGTRRSRATTTWVYGGRSTADLSAAETWHAECRVDPWIAAEGIVFIVVAVVMMAIGLGLELFFKNGLKGKKLRYLLQQRSLKGEEKQQMWERCVECECGNIGVPLVRFPDRTKFC